MAIVTVTRKRRARAITFICKGCKRPTPESRGSDDDMPDHCDDCWAAAHPELVPAGTAVA